MNTNNVVILTSSQQQQGGFERFGFYLRDGLQKAGHTVTLIGREDLSPFQSKIVALKKKFGMEHPALGYFLGRIAKKRGFDVCVTNGMLGWNLKRGKIVNVQHSTFAKAADRIDRGNWPKFFMKKYVWGFLEGLAARRATRCVAVSQETKESVEHYYHAKNVVVVQNATDTELFFPMSLEKKNRALFVGRFEHAKGREILEGLKKYLNAKGWELFVAEKLTQKELAAAYNESKVFLLPSLHEGCSYALLDAMACGLPFLASPVGMVPELVKEEVFAECIVSEQTVEAYVKKLEHLIGLSDEENAKLSKDLRAYILKFHSIEPFNAAYQSLIGKLS